ncbi:MAG: sigma-70 family RNA polymerase sigma factor [Holosporales bacterium]|jgi:RNA polymerase sigma-32 factor|nr:sigma-70 family RNA polymerase sigma factor [Holosporales bacterium]
MSHSRSFLDIIRLTPNLSKDEEVQAFHQWKTCASLSGREKLLRSHLKLVMKVSKNVASWNCAFDVEEIFSEGVLGLIHAIQLFDPSKGATLATYALYWIKAYTRRWTRRAFSVVHRANCYCSNDKDKNCIIADESLDRKVDDTRYLLDLIPDQAVSQEECLLMHDELQQSRKILKKALSVLSPEELCVIKARYGGDVIRTLKSISENIGFSTEGVRRIEIRSIKKLQNAIQRYGKFL